MYISNRNKKIGKKKGEKVAWRLGFILFFAFVWFGLSQSGEKTPFFSALAITVVIGWVFVWVFVSIFQGIFIGYCSRKLQKETNNYHHRRKRQKQKQANKKYEIELKRNLDRKRAELALEFEHLERVAKLKASHDEGKMREIAKIESNFRRAKDEDLADLDRQIQRMRNSL